LLRKLPKILGVTFLPQLVVYLQHGGGSYCSQNDVSVTQI